MLDPSKFSSPTSPTTEEQRRGRKVKKNETSHYRALLMALKANAFEGLPNRENLAVERVPDVIDDIAAESGRQLAAMTLNNQSELARDINLALERIESGIYGKCQNCEVEITPKRLNAVPWTQYCVTCAEAEVPAKAPSSKLAVTLSISKTAAPAENSTTPEFPTQSGRRRPVPVMSINCLGGTDTIWDKIARARNFMGTYPARLCQ